MKQGLLATRTVRRAVTAVVAGMISAAIPGTAQATPEFTQTFTLQPGWNAIFLEVQPEPRDPATVFAGLAVDGVWTWLPRHTTMEYIRNPAEESWGDPGWRGYRPGKPAAVSNLHAILPHRAYLINYLGAVPADWGVTGTPSAHKAEWAADSFSLVGFPVDPASPPSLAAYFGPSDHHRGQAVYRLGDTGTWEFVDDPASTAIDPGAAYWVWTEGVSAYAGPMPVELPGTGLDYGAGLEELAVSLRNDTAADLTVDWAVTNATAPGVLARKVYDPVTGYFAWSALPFSVTVGAGRTVRFVIVVKRENMSGPEYDAVLVITNDLGTRTLVPVSAKRGS